MSLCPRPCFTVSRIVKFYIFTVCASGVKRTGFFFFRLSATSCMNETIGLSAAFAQRTNTL